MVPIQILSNVLLHWDAPSPPVTWIHIVNGIVPAPIIIYQACALGMPSVQRLCRPPMWLEELPLTLGILLGMVFLKTPILSTLIGINPLIAVKSLNDLLFVDVHLFQMLVMIAVLRAAPVNHLQFPIQVPTTLKI